MVEWLPAAIGAAGNLIGGMLGRDSVEQQQESNVALQREFAQHGIRWKVEDAKAAGLHPLFALGGAGAAFAPNPVVLDPMAESMRDMGQNLSRAVSAAQSKPETELQQAQLALVRAQAAESDMRRIALEQEAARKQQEFYQAKAFPVSAPPIIIQRPLDGTEHGKSQGQLGPGEKLVQGGRVKLKPDEQIQGKPGDPSTTAGTHAFSREYQVGRFGAKVSLPYSEEGPSEAFENIPWYAWPGVLAHNVGRYGWDWLPRAWHDYVYDKGPRFRGDPWRKERQIREAAPRFGQW